VRFPAGAQGVEQQHLGTDPGITVVVPHAPPPGRRQQQAVRRLPCLGAGQPDFAGEPAAEQQLHQRDVAEHGVVEPQDRRPQQQHDFRRVAGGALLPRRLVGAGGAPAAGQPPHRNRPGGTGQLLAAEGDRLEHQLPARRDPAGARPASRSGTAGDVVQRAGRPDPVGAGAVPAPPHADPEQQPLRR
jgi:hypothetical protein